MSEGRVGNTLQLLLKETNSTAKQTEDERETLTTQKKKDREGVEQHTFNYWQNQQTYRLEPWGLSGPIRILVLDADGCNRSLPWASCLHTKSKRLVETQKKGTKARHETYKQIWLTNKQIDRLQRKKRQERRRAKEHTTNKNPWKENKQADKLAECCHSSSKQTCEVTGIQEWKYQHFCLWQTHWATMGRVMRADSRAWCQSKWKEETTTEQIRENSEQKDRHADRKCHCVARGAVWDWQCIHFIAGCASKLVFLVVVV
jgi:hypothetical protein